MSKTDITDLSEAVEAAPESVEKPARKTVAKEVKGANADGELSGKRVVLTIHATQEQDGDEDVFIGLNGYGYKIKRGEPCNVPVEVADIIKNAKVAVIRPAKDGGVSESETPRFAYSISAVV
jgi:hypothetical protein